MSTIDLPRGPKASNADTEQCREETASSLRGTAIPAVRPWLRADGRRGFLRSNGGRGGIQYFR